MAGVVIIDDEASERFVLRGILEERGWEVLGEGSDGGEALKLCVDLRPDVLIMDVRMPGRDGVEAAEDIRGECPTPVVLLTGIEDKETVSRAARAGVMAYLVKPVREEELFAAMELAASRHEEFQALRKENAGLKSTLEARKVIERAKGLLMEREGLAESEAYARIQKTSMNRRLSMKQVAEIIISTFEEKESSG